MSYYGVFHHSVLVCRVHTAICHIAHDVVGDYPSASHGVCWLSRDLLAQWYAQSPYTNIVDFRGFDSSTILALRGGILMSIGDFPEVLSQTMLLGTMLVGRLGVLEEHQWLCEGNECFARKLCFFVVVARICVDCITYIILGRLGVTPACFNKMRQLSDARGKT